MHYNFKLLFTIHELKQNRLQHNCFTGFRIFTLSLIVVFAIFSINKNKPLIQKYSVMLYKSHICFCFLQAHPLKKITLLNAQSDSFYFIFYKTPFPSPLPPLLGHAGSFLYAEGTLEATAERSPVRHSFYRYFPFLPACRIPPSGRSHEQCSFCPARW